jgi:beta-fructofuranosidase
MSHTALWNKKSFFDFSPKNNKSFEMFYFSVMTSEQERIQTANNSVMSAHEILKEDPSRPQYHLLPPAMWMNDPNGPIYYGDKYHLFYQHQPFKPKWGIMYWGHAESPDLINWTHLPIALAPDRENGERYCFSGCCLNNNGIPTILYSSIKSLGLDIIFGAETWSATSDSDLIQWRRNPSNPILDISIHGGEKVRQIRDPYVWRENELWHMVLGGQLVQPRRGAIFHYISSDLESWSYMGLLCEGNPKTHKKSWECPNVLKWEEKSVILISPFDKVQYAILPVNEEEIKWKIFDHGRSFYAPNSMKHPINDEEYILWGWIKGGGLSKYWNGCFSIPRILSMKHKVLNIKPSPILNSLRTNHHQFNDQNALINLANGCGEIILNQVGNSKFSIDIYRHPNQKFECIFEPSENSLTLGEEKAFLSSVSENNVFHIYLDRSVLEVFINYEECFSAKYHSNSYSDIVVDCKFSSPLEISTDAWELNPISHRYKLK